MKKYRKLLIKIFVSCVLLFIIFKKVDKNALISNFKLLDYRFIPLIILGLVLNYVFSSIRWKALLIHKNTDHVKTSYLINLYFVGAFFNNFMPTSIGGDVYKVYKLGKKINNTVDAFSATFMERFTGVVALGIISVVSLIKLLRIWGIILFLGFFVGVYFGYLVLSLLSHKFPKFKQIYDSINLYRTEKKVLIFAFITSFLVQIFSIFTQYFIFLALGIKLPLVYSFFVFPLINIAGFFIPSLNGIGIQDALYMKLFNLVGIPDVLSLSASILFHMFKLGVSLVGGVLYAVDKTD